MYIIYKEVSIVTALLAIIIFSKHAYATGLTDDQALDNVPNVPVKWMDPFATVDVKEQPKLDWGPVPKPGDTGKGTGDSKTDVIHAVEDLLGQMQDVDKNTHDANEGHLIDFWLSGNELPPELLAHLTDKIGSSLGSPGVPDVIGTGLGSGTGNITFVGNPDSHGQGGTDSQPSTVTSFPTTVTATTMKMTTTMTEAPTTTATITTKERTTISKGPTKPSTQQTTTIETTQAIMTPNPTSAQQIISVQNTTPKLSRKQLQKLRKLKKQKQRELKRQQAIEARRLAKMKKAEKAEQARIAREKAKQERLAKKQAKQEQAKLKRQQQNEARRLAREKIKARALAARKALADLRKKARTDKMAAARLAKLEARFSALRQKQLQAKTLKKKKKNTKPKPTKPKKLSAAEIKRQEQLFLQGLMH